MADRNSGKLVYLREHSRRAHPKPVRSRGESPGKPVELGAPTLQETMWLTRSLFGLAAMIVASWLAVGVGLTGADRPIPPAWLAALVVADVFVGVLAVAGALQLRAARERDMIGLVAAGGIGFLCVARLVHAFVLSLEVELTAGSRLEVSFFALSLGVAVWIVSYSARLRRPERQS